MPANEHLCMQLARRIGVPAAARLATALTQQLPGLATLAAGDGIAASVARAIADVIEAQASRCLALAPLVAKAQARDV